MTTTQTTQTQRAELLTAAAAIAAATAGSGAEAIRFDNTTNYAWLFSTLDLTLSAQDQTAGGVGDVTGTSIYMDYFGDYFPMFTYGHTYASGTGAEVFSTGAYATPLDAGTLIDGSLMGGSFSQGANFEFSFYACDYPDYVNCYSGNRGLLPEGQDTYLGVRLSISGELHYGWIGVNRSGAILDVFAWGYETQAGVGIGAGAPAPGPLSLLALGAAGALSRKKRLV